MSTMYGIDLSKWNKVTDYTKIKDFGLDFAIIRAGGNYGGFYKDPAFEQHYAGCKNAGLSVGAYYDCGKEFIGDVTGRDFANHFLKLLDGIKELDEKVQILGPVPSAVSKIKNKYRWQILIKCNDNDKLNKMLKNAYEECVNNKNYAGVSIIIDKNPNMIF